LPPTRPFTPPDRSRYRAVALPVIAALAALLACPIAQAGNLTSPESIEMKRELANAGESPHVEDRQRLLAQADEEWRWGSVSGAFVTTLQAGAKRCHPASNPGLSSYLKDGAPDAYARILAYLLSATRDAARAEDARHRVLELVGTSGFHGLAGTDYSASNQCILELAISIPVWIETALLLESTPVWSAQDRSLFAGWLATEVYPKVAWASRVRRNNWGAAGSAAASLIAHYVDGEVAELIEPNPSPRSLTPARAKAEHDGVQVARIGTTWQGDTRCKRVGIQSHGGIPDELRRGNAGCEGLFLPSREDAGHTYQTMHVELLVLHAEALRRQGDTSLFDAQAPGGAPALLQAILFVIDNPSPGGKSWPWGTRSGALAMANLYYDDPRLAREIERGEGFRGGRTLPYAALLPPRPEPPMLLAP
jgi:hypothetical protein